MIKIKIEDNCYFFEGEKDVIQFIKESYGGDLGAYVKSLNAEGVIAKERIDSDLESYKCILDSQRSAFNEIMNIIEETQEEMKDKTCKKNIEKALKNVLNIINEVI